MVAPCGGPKSISKSQFFLIFVLALICGIGPPAYIFSKDKEAKVARTALEATFNSTEIAHIEQMRNAFKKTVSGTTVRYTVGNKECVGLARGAVNINNNSFSIKTFRDQNIPTGRMLTKSFLLAVSDVRHPDMNDAVWKDMVAQFEMQEKCT